VIVVLFRYLSFTRNIRTTQKFVTTLLQGLQCYCTILLERFSVAAILLENRNVIENITETLQCSCIISGMIYGVLLQYY